MFGLGTQRRWFKAPPSLPPGVRVYAMSDIHGRCDLFEANLDRILRLEARDPAPNPYLILIGDLIDRGPASSMLVDLLCRFGDRIDRIALLPLLGNHEDLFLDMMAGQGAATRLWLENGGIETLASYGILNVDPAADDLGPLWDAAHAAVPSEHVAFLRDRPLFTVLGSYLFVHAGVRPGIALEEQTRHDLLWIRDEFLNHDEPFEHFVIHGHTPTRRPDFRRNRINIDTLAVLSGRLTCLLLEEDKVRVF